MLLTLTLTRPPATDLGHLLHKHPERLQSFSLPFGQAHVFYREANEERCTAVLMLEVDPPLRARIAALPCAGGEGCCGGWFEPLGFGIHPVDHPLDEQFPEWGESRYFTVELEGELRVRELQGAVPLQARALDALDRASPSEESELVFPGERGGYLDVHHFAPISGDRRNAQPASIRSGGYTIFDTPLPPSRFVLASPPSTSLASWARASR